MNTRLLTAAAFVFCLALMHTPAWAIVIYNSRTTLLPAAGPGLLYEGFDDVTLGEDGLAVFSNGATFGEGAFSIESLTFTSDATLNTGHVGTFLIGPKSNSAEVNRQLLPGGGGGTSDPGDDDDIRITFTQPVRAFGMLIIENLTEPNERIILNGAGGREVLSMPLPGGSSGAGNSHFVGFVAESELDYIYSLDIEEGQILNDDIGFAWFYYDPVPEPGSLALLAVSAMACTFRGRRR